MADLTWKYLPCGDWASRNQTVRLGWSQRRIVISAPASDVTTWSLQQAEDLHANLGEMIDAMRARAQQDKEFV